VVSSSDFLLPSGAVDWYYFAFFFRGDPVVCRGAWKSDQGNEPLARLPPPLFVLE